MTATLSAARSFTAEPYLSAAQELDSQGRLISQASEDVSNVRVSVNDSWQGNAASAFATKTKAVEKSGEQLSENLSLHAQLLIWYAGAKSRACRSAVAVADNAKAKGFDVSNTWKLSLSAQQLAGNNAGFQVFEMAVFQLVIDAHVNLIAQVDSQAIMALGGGASNSVTLPGSSTKNSSTPDVTSNGYTVGRVPEREIDLDNNFPFGSKKGRATVWDHANWLKWEGVLRGGQSFRPDLDDALPMYEHFRDKSGTPMTFDYEEGYKEDPGIRREINREMNKSLVAANELVKGG